MVFPAKRNGVVKQKFRAAIFNRFHVVDRFRGHGEPRASARNAKPTIPYLRRESRVLPCRAFIKLLGLDSCQNGVLEIVRRGALDVRSNNPAAKTSAAATSSRAVLLVLFLTSLVDP